MVVSGQAKNAQCFHLGLRLIQVLRYVSMAKGFVAQRLLRVDSSYPRVTTGVFTDDYVGAHVN
jgi:hypothetical protein